MSYDPFLRGSFPVGVRSAPLHDPERERELAAELWYPAADEHRGQDLDEATCDRFRVMPPAPETSQDAVRDAALRSGQHPVVVFSHGWGGHRRQTTHLCTHLASHGYVVVSTDHTGNTMLDMMQHFISMQSGGAMPDPRETAMESIRHRPLDVSFLLDQLLAGKLELPADSLDAGRIGITGHSFGGWTTLCSTGRDSRIRAALPLAPAGGSSPLLAGDESNPLAESLDLEWDRDVPTLFLVAEFDTLLPMDGMRELYGRTTGSKRMVVLRDSDHMHFCDRVEETHEIFRSMSGMMAKAMPTGVGDVASVLENLRPASELCPGDHAYAFVQGLGLAHMDAHLREREHARDFLATDLNAQLGERGVKVEVIEE